MKIACLQFAPELGNVKENMDKADRILESTSDLRPPTDGRPLWLILPELAFSGYNFQDQQEITPYLEHTAAGPTTEWASRTARRYRCYVTAGYPETARKTDPSGPMQVNYNSAVTVSPAGIVLANYRKRYLYYTDETWADEGDNTSTPSGFYAGTLDRLGNVAFGICMDINPYKFEAPWTAYEFANHILDHRVQLAAVSMAWLTRLTPQELGELPLRPDEETFAYWVERFRPLQANSGQPIFVVLANRCGTEKHASYAGTSTVICFKSNRVSIYDVLGKCEEKCLVVDLQKAAKYELMKDSTSGAAQAP